MVLLHGRSLAPHNRGMMKPLYMVIRITPKRVRDDLFKLQAFVSTVSSFAKNGHVEEFERIENRWNTAKSELSRKQVPTPLSDTALEHSLAGVAYLVHRHSFDPAWVDAFFKSMRWELQKHSYRSLKDLNEYMYGSAEVLGLMTARIIGLPDEHMKAVRCQARAIQYITFLRTIGEQNGRGFSYFPANDIKKYGLKNLSEDEARKKPGMLADFIHAELLRYAQWQADATEDFAHIPRRYRVLLETLVDAHTATARHLKYEPLSVYETSYTPRRRQLIGGVVRHSLKNRKY